MKKIFVTSLVITVTLLISITAHAATYHVSHNKFGSWSMGCNIVTKGNKITTVKNLSLKPTLGSITNKSVTITSGDAHIRFTRHIQALSYHSNVKISVTGSKVYVTTN
ncbi:DUF5626 family protein [Secundilactobacillus folii]|uniref:DUF5626 domain-containing protein n=1 Tax=Secundilactobacillus folii TaxID=2678357 RepID=A0A7X2XTP5_9LACO|nr:DUF5626 family protein [Secundilactobacillus folii]MTV81393.1 hypothetical protein [Secundilactobacillus folii]